MVVFHRIDRDPRFIFADMEEEMIYIPCDEDGKVLEEVTLRKGDSFYVIGEEAYRQEVEPMVCPNGILKRLGWPNKT